jgi:Inhibitor of Apoptosis domain
MDEDGEETVPPEPVPPDDYIIPSDQVNIPDESEFIERLFTFEFYYGDGDDEALAKAGWRSYKFSSIVYCYFCNTRAHNIDESDRVLLLHHLLYPDCEFLRQFTFLNHDILNEDEIELLDRCRMT